MLVPARWVSLIGCCTLVSQLPFLQNKVVFLEECCTGGSGVPGSIWDAELLAQGIWSIQFTQGVTQGFSLPLHTSSQWKDCHLYPIHSAHCYKDLSDLKRNFLVSPVATAGGQRGGRARCSHPYYIPG